MRKLLEDFFQHYLVERDLEGTLSFVTDDMVNVGTGAHEIGWGKAAFRDLLRQEFAELPDSFRYEILEHSELHTSENSCTVFESLRVTLNQDDGDIVMNARMTCSCVLRSDGWKLASLHISVPSTEQAEGSFFPLRYGSDAIVGLTQKSNAELMKLVSDYLPGGIMGNYTKPDFPLYTINAKMLNILGYQYNELCELFDEKVLMMIYEQDRERVESELAEQLAQGDEYELEYRMLGKGGNLIWVNDIGRKIITADGQEAIISIVTDITERVSRDAEQAFKRWNLEMIAYTDSLTEMGNRAAFRKALVEFSQHPRAACVVADVNNLKICNDRYGHQEGDLLLMDAAHCIRQAFEELGVCFRIGGDEFCILIPDGEITEILGALEKVHELIEQRNQSRTAPLSIAFGYAFRENGNENIEHLFNRSDEMMYDAKHRMKQEFPVYRTEKIANYLSVLQVLSKSTDDYLFLWDIGKDEFWYLGGIERRYPIYIGAKPTVSSADLEACVYPPDWTMLTEDLDKVARGEKLEHNLDYRWVDRNGEVVWINCRGKAIPDDKGKPFCMIGRISDQILRYLYNPMTKLFNKEKMFQAFDETFYTSGYFMLLSIDHLSEINLQYGWHHGNEIIRECAKRLDHAGITRDVYHVDSNCFSLYLPVQTEDEVCVIYHQISDLLADLCTVSVGIVPNSQEMFGDAQNLFDCAKLTLENAKNIGSQSILFYSRENLNERNRTIQILHELHTSVLNGCKGFYLCYQPQVKTGNYQIYGAEALLRYRSDSLGAVYPDEFIPLLEQSKLINQVGLWVLHEALLHCKYWRKTIPDFRISVNFSAVQLSEPAVAEAVLDILDSVNLPGNALTIELTESIQLQGIAGLSGIFKRWRSVGIELSIDDFGTGYSSMSYLKELEVSEIKIDRLFVEGVEEATYNYRLISNMIEFAKNNNIRVCCEGVEELQELTVLEQLAPNLIQGYLFAKPCEEKQFERAFIDTESEEYREREEFLQTIYQYKNKMHVLHFDTKDILRETDVGLWIIRIAKDGSRCEMHADETMERVLSVDRKYTPQECYAYWFGRIRSDYTEYVRRNVDHMMETPNVVQLQYPWNHPQLGEVYVRCSGKRTEDSDDMITLKGYHRLLDTLEVE